MTGPLSVKPDNVSEIEALARGLEVPDCAPDTYAPLLGVLLNCKRQTKALEEQRDLALVPAKKAVAQIREYFDPALSQLKKIESSIRASACCYLDVCQTKRLADAGAGLVVDDPPPGVAGVSKREVWDFEITNFAALGEEFKEPNLKAIRTHMKDTGDSPLWLAGVRFFRRTTLIVRA